MTQDKPLELDVSQFSTKGQDWMESEFNHVSKESVNHVKLQTFNKHLDTKVWMSFPGWQYSVYYQTQWPGVDNTAKDSSTESGQLERRTGVWIPPRLCPVSSFG